MIVGTGIDIAEVPRIRQSIARFGDRFLQRIYTGGRNPLLRFQGQSCRALRRTLRRQRSGDEGSGHRLEPRRALAGLRSGALAGRTSDHHFSRKSRRDRRPAGREACRALALAYGRAGHRASHSRKLGALKHACHPERSEGPWFLPAPPIMPLHARTRILRCASG